LLEEALYPQFPDVSAEVLSKGVGGLLVEPLIKRPNKNSVIGSSSARLFSTANRSKHPSLFRDHTERELVGMIHFREGWGAEKDKRLWKQIIGSDIRG
jgi:hypothetical protein